MRRYAILDNMTPEERTDYSPRHVSISINHNVL